MTIDNIINTYYTLVEDEEVFADELGYDDPNQMSALGESYPNYKHLGFMKIDPSYEDIVGDQNEELLWFEKVEAPEGDIFYAYSCGGRLFKLEQEDFDRVSYEKDSLTESKDEDLYSVTGRYFCSGDDKNNYFFHVVAPESKFWKEMACYTNPEVSHTGVDCERLSGDQLFNRYLESMKNWSGEDFAIFDMRKNGESKLQSETLDKLKTSEFPDSVIKEYTGRNSLTELLEETSSLEEKFPLHK